MISDSFSLHEPVVIPTDTIYGLAAPYNDERALERIYEIKGRSLDKPLAVCLPDLESVALLSNPSKEAAEIMRKTSPGPFTYIVPAVKGLPKLIVKDHKIALRIKVNHRAFFHKNRFSVKKKLAIYSESRLSYYPTWVERSDTGI